MLRAVRKLFASLKQPRAQVNDDHARHLAWDRACRARGMTVREQADELQLRCAWVRLRQKASAAVLKKPARSREILDRVAADEARTLAAIGGGGLAAVFLRAYEAAEPMEILSPEAATLVGASCRMARVSAPVPQPTSSHLSLPGRASHLRNSGATKRLQRPT
jgi:hypothetical protein